MEKANEEKINRSLYCDAIDAIDKLTDIAKLEQLIKMAEWRIKDLQKELSQPQNQD